MDTNGSTLSTLQLAERLGISLPRVHRLLDREGVAKAAGRGRAREVPAAVVERVIRKVGAVPIRIKGLSRTDMQVLAAITRTPLGMESHRAVARKAGVSPTAAGESLRRLSSRHFVERIQRREVRGVPRDLRLWVADYGSDAWNRETLAATAKVVLPTRNAGPAAAQASASDSRLRSASGSSPRRVPRRFDHLFWNVNPRKLDPTGDSDFIAARLMGADDPSAWNWATANLPKQSLLNAARMRGVPSDRRSLIINLANRTEIT